MKQTRQKFPHYKGNRSSVHKPHQQPPMGYNGGATYGYQNYQYPMTPLQTPNQAPNSAQFPYPSPQFPQQPVYGYSQPHPVNQYPIQHNSLPTPTTKASRTSSKPNPVHRNPNQHHNHRTPSKMDPPAAPILPQEKKESAPLPAKNEETKKPVSTTDTDNWQTEFPGVTFCGSLNQRRKPQYGPMIDMSEFDAEDFDFDTPSYPGPGETVDERFSIGQSGRFKEMRIHVVYHAYFLKSGVQPCLQVIPFRPPSRSQRRTPRGASLRLALVPSVQNIARLPQQLRTC
jgi:hypothetical protein